MDNKLIEKKIISQGKGSADLTDGAKVIFHVRTETCHDPPRLIDDSKTWTKPVELLLGKKFKLEVWEACLRTMAVEEVSSFKIDKSLISTYPIVAKTLREAFHKDYAGKKKEDKGHHCCGMGLKEGLGHKDLDILVANPVDLKFTIDLVKVEGAGNYEKEFWAMSEDERIDSIPTLREEGNKLYKESKHAEASKKYSEALGRLEQLMIREKPGDEEWDILNDMKMPILLNFSQCQLMQGEYYTVIEHCSTVLTKNPDNVKALFRRGKAYIEVFNAAEARSDLLKAAELDESIAPGCKKLLDKLAMMEKQQNIQDKTKYSKMFS